MAKEYTNTPDEVAFLAALDAALKAAKKSPSYEVTRMANGALSVRSRRAYLGKVKLQGRKTWMQYMTGTYTSHPPPQILGQNRIERRVSHVWEKEKGAPGGHPLDAL